MLQIPLATVPNQQFSLNLDNNAWDITIQETNGVMSATILRNNVLIQSGIRIVAGLGLLPFPYEEDGNFVIITLNDDLPNYLQFEITQFLIYASQDELNALRASN